ncbi:MAG: valine--tRNA ligase [Planctomycetes bacterium]|nr:valine--tRNA ligase [Planctomycetota bacterium]HJM57075.1 valine--tRNA ligase [Planctomycetota bacterium]
MDLSKRYQPADLEGPIYSAWESGGAFQAPAEGEGSGKPFSIVIPPPNVTGVLHMGHALNGTLQDIVIRHRRKAGFDTVWVPGTDHAGIATQAVVEKKLFAEENKTREDLGREAFLAKVWEWKEEHGNIILEQFRRLGCSCDWSRTAFTMDEDLSHAVRTAFVDLWSKGLIYRGSRLVNWDCVLETAISDDEIENVERKGKLWTLRYPLNARPGEFISVATTRPETMLGDTGVAVHPDDERYKDLVGTTCRLPLVERDIPIVADESVDPDFGSGAVKVTPGHDPADHERGERHNLPIINILEKDGRINEAGGEFAGQARELARKNVLAALEEKDLLGEIEEIRHNVPLSDRSKSIVEPLVSEQWFVSMQPLAEPALKALDKGWLEFRPERWGKVYRHWLENVHDWCISRQLWWGHRIPVWYDEDDVPVASVDELEIGAAHPETGKPIVRQDPDVLDTWASSWLWPIANFGWPDATSADLARFYPTQFLSTASEIIYLWVARMVMAGYAFMPERSEEERNPFKTCYIHATVLDGKGKRMSKSAGNGIDPLDMIEQYGADAVRYSLVLLTKEGQDVRLSPDRFEQGSRFCNKVWNAARFVMMNLEGERSPEPVELEDRWILSRLKGVSEEVGQALESYRFNDAASTLYRFVWNDFCDWYLELAKGRFGESDASAASSAAARGVLTRVLTDILGLLHPFTPFLTEELWTGLHETLGQTPESDLIRAPFPDGSGLEVDEASVSEMAVLQGIVGAVRRVRTLTTVGERKPLVALISAPRAEERDVIERHASTIRTLAFLGEMQVGEALERPAGSAVSVFGGLEVFVPLGEETDLGKLKEVLENRANKVRSARSATEAKLANENFVSRADPAIVEGERERLNELGVELELLTRNLEGL